MKKIKILRVIARLNIGGPAQNVIFLSGGLNEGDFETLLIAGRPQKDEGDMSFLAKARNIRLQIIPQLSRHLSLINDIIAFFKIFLVILKEQPGIIHTHTAKAGALGRTAGITYNFFAKKKIKLVHTFHGHVLEGYFGALRTRVFIFIEKTLACFTDILISVSEAGRKDLLKFRIGCPEKIRVVPLGLELEKLLGINNQERAQTANDSFNVGIIGRLVPIKNHKLFLDAAKLLVNRSPHLVLRFIIVGDGELKNRLQDYVKEIGLADYVEFTGWQRDLKKIYANLDIVCLTSFNEGTPVSLIEAMSAAKAVVATNVGGVQELICDNSFSRRGEGFQICDRGILVEIEDAEALAGALETLWKDKELREAKGEKAREFARAKFNKERLTLDMKNLYFNLLADK